MENNKLNNINNITYEDCDNCIHYFNGDRDIECDNCKLNWNLANNFKPKNNG